MLNEKVNIFGPVWVQLGLGIAEMGPNNLWIDCFFYFFTIELVAFGLRMLENESD